MAVSPAPGDPPKTLWRDRLVIGGAIAPVLWPVLWSIWQWRGARIACAGADAGRTTPSPRTAAGADG